MLKKVLKLINKVLAQDFSLSLTLYATSFRRVFFNYHHAMTHPHSNIMLSLFSIPLVLKCAAKILKIGS